VGAAGGSPAVQLTAAQTSRTRRSVTCSGASATSASRTQAKFSRRGGATRVTVSQARRKSAYLIALSGYAHPDDVRRVQESGFQRHAAKPVDPRAARADLQRGAALELAGLTASLLEPGRLLDEDLAALCDCGTTTLVVLLEEWEMARICGQRVSARPPRAPEPVPMNRFRASGV
jgi:CheY-like chemotaxis protein